MGKTKVIENFPEYAVNFAYYGKDETLTEDEKNTITKFIKNYEFLGIVENSENGFCNFPAFGLPCRTVSINIRVEN